MIVTHSPARSDMASTLPALALDEPFIHSGGSARGGVGPPVAPSPQRWHGVDGVHTENAFDGRGGSMAGGMGPRGDGFPRETLAERVANTRARKTGSTLGHSTADAHGHPQPPRRLDHTARTAAPQALPATPPPPLKHCWYDGEPLRPPAGAAGEVALHRRPLRRPDHRRRPRRDRRGMGSRGDVGSRGTPLACLTRHRATPGCAPSRSLQPGQPRWTRPRCWGLSVGARA